MTAPPVTACPLLGLPGDPATRFSFPHDAHRCFADRKPATVAIDHQGRFCLSPDFAECPRYRARPDGAPTRKSAGANASAKAGPGATATAVAEVAAVPAVRTEVPIAPAQPAATAPGTAATLPSHRDQPAAPTTPIAPVVEAPVSAVSVADARPSTGRRAQMRSIAIIGGSTVLTVMLAALMLEDMVR